ncbi:TRAFAC clade GTPase domain-containing protein [Frankia sp. Cas3]|uniref:TRAFAC clade GTPase domain-containing protein n=1 Tax=Frankia sp. Cas3 TaxID=3073926 RepID=UPI002AD4BF7A|nr:hypothetical protein [Frankia sp. Cas3]
MGEAMAQLNCPFCFEAVPLKSLCRRCPEECGEEPDVELSRFRGQENRTISLPKVFTPTTRKKDLCPHGKIAQRTHLCPHCHNDLEYDYVVTAAGSRPIALIGASGSGKSVYVGVLVRELKNRVGSAFNGMAVEFVGDASRAHYDQVFRVPMFERGVTLEMTASIRRSKRLDPLLFTLKFPGAARRWSDRMAIAMMVFLDTSGEDVLEARFMSRLARYLDAAAGIIMIVDPLQMPNVRDSVSTTVYPRGATRQVDVLERLGALLREQRKLGPGKRVDTPLAVVLSKIDTLTDILPDQSSLRRQAEHAGYYDEADGQLVHEEVRAWIQKWYGEGFIDSIEASFSVYRFFGMSALGTAPPAEGRISPSGIRPLRVEDPMLWLLNRFGFVRPGEAKI